MNAPFIDPLMAQLRQAEQAREAQQLHTFHLIVVIAVVCLSVGSLIGMAVMVLVDK